MDHKLNLCSTVHQSSGYEQRSVSWHVDMEARILPKYPVIGTLSGWHGTYWGHLESQWGHPHLPHSCRWDNKNQGTRWMSGWPPLEHSPQLQASRPTELGVLETDEWETIILTFIKAFESFLVHWLKFHPSLKQNSPENPGVKDMLLKRMRPAITEGVWIVGKTYWWSMISLIHFASHVVWFLSR